MTISNVAAGTDTSLDNYDYTFTTMEKTFTINKKQLSVIWSVSDNALPQNTATGEGASFTATYNGNTWTPSATLSGVCAADVGAVTANSVAFNATALNANTYTATATLATGGANYAIDVQYATCTFHIETIKVFYTWTPVGDGWFSNEHEFDGNTHSIIAVPDETYVAGETITFTYTGNSARDVNRNSGSAAVGSYTAHVESILINGASTSNYVLDASMGDCVWSIYPTIVNNGTNDIVVSINPSITYDAAEHAAALNHSTTRFNEEIDSVRLAISALVIVNETGAVSTVT